MRAISEYFEDLLIVWAIMCLGQRIACWSDETYKTIETISSLKVISQEIRSAYIIILSFCKWREYGSNLIHEISSK